MKIAIGCDQNGFELKMHIIKYLNEKNIELKDFGCYENEQVLYPNIAEKVAKEISTGNYDRGILVCGTGIGMAIAANKVPGIRAAQCHDVYSAERARKSNNAQIMTMGAEIVGKSLAISLVEKWLESDFSGGRSLPKVSLIDKIDDEYRKKVNL